MLDASESIVKKIFLIAGLSNSLGGYEDHLIRNDESRKEVEGMPFDEVFGEVAMGFQAPNDQSDDDPFKSDEIPQ